MYNKNVAFKLNIRCRKKGMNENIDKVIVK